MAFLCAEYPIQGMALYFSCNKFELDLLMDQLLKMKRTIILQSLLMLLLLPCLIQAQSFKAEQRYYDGRYFLVTEDYRPGKHNKYFALDMETAKQLPDTVLARQLFKYQLGNEVPMQDFVNDTAKSKQKYKLMKWRDKRPGSLYYRDIKAFDEILSRDEELLKKKKKEDKKNNIYNQYYMPSELILFHEKSECYYLFSTYGIYSVHQDSLKMPARTVFEYTGFLYKSLVSAKFFNSDVYVMEFELGNHKTFYKVFDIQTTAFTNIPGLDEIQDPHLLESRSSPYLIFYGRNNSNKDFDSKVILYNYNTLEVVSNIGFTFSTVSGGEMYLHKNILYRKYDYLLFEWHTGLNAYDLKNNGKLVYSFKIK